MARYLYSELASLLDARKNCASMYCENCKRDLRGLDACIEGHIVRRSNPEWFDKHEDTIERLVSNHLPSGSGFDNGTKLDLDASHAEKLVFTTSFHHMDDAGWYDGWTEHTVVVTPSLRSGFNLRIGGRNRRDIKEYIEETFDHALRTDVEWDLFAPYVNINLQWHHDDKTGHTEIGVHTDGGETLATCADWDKAKAFAVAYVMAHRDETRKAEVSPNAV